MARLHALETAHRRLEAEIALTVAALAEARGFTDDGHSSVRALLRAEVRWSEGDITNRIRTGNMLSDLPDVVDALGSGAVGVAQVHALARARANPRCGHLLVDDAAILLRHARTLDFITSTSAFAGGSCWPTPMQRTATQQARTRLATRSCASATVSGISPGTEVRSTRPSCRRSRTAAGKPAGTKLPEPTVNIVMDATTFERAVASLNLIPRAEHDQGTVPFDHRRCETASGVLVDPCHAVRVALFGHVRRVVVDGAGNVVDLGRRRRLFTGAARDAVMLHSPRCIWPGCTTPAGRCDADHTHDWQHGGATAPANGAPMCPGTIAARTAATACAATRRGTGTRTAQTAPRSAPSTKSSGMPRQGVRAASRAARIDPFFDNPLIPTTESPQ